MNEYNGPLEAVDCDLGSVGYDMVLEYVSSLTSSGHLRRCSNAGTYEKSMSSDKATSILS